jgi:hypothetical protein
MDFMSTRLRRARVRLGGALLVLVACGDDGAGAGARAGSTGSDAGQERDGGSAAQGPGGPDAGLPADGGPNAGPELRGWLRTDANTGLARVGLDCAGLAPYAGPAKPPPGTTIVEKRIETSLDLSNGNITIERSCIKPKSVGPGLPVITTTDYNDCTNEGCAVTKAMVTIRDSEIDGSDVSTEEISRSCAFSGVGTLERNYVHGVGSGICFFGTGLELDAVADGNLVRGLRAYGDPATTGSHNESLTVRDFPTDAKPSRRMRIRNNLLECKTGNDSGAIFIQSYAGDIDQVLIEGNLLVDGGYQLVLEANGGNVYGKNMSAVDNRFSGTGYGPGYVDGKGLSYGFSVWKDNHLHDPTKPDHKGAVVAAF